MALSFGHWREIIRAGKKDGDIDRWAKERCDVKQQDHVMSQHSLWMSYCRWTADTARAVRLTRNEFWSTLQKSRHRNRLVPRSFVVSEPAEGPGKEPWSESTAGGGEELRYRGNLECFSCRGPHQGGTPGFGCWL